MSDKKIRIGITQGDVNGIGYEIMLKVLADPRLCELCTPVVYGNSRIASYYRKTIPSLEAFTFNVIASAADASPKRPNLINVIGDDAKLEVGQSTSLAGQYAVAALQAAMRDAEAGELDAIVTCPINKANVQGADFGFVGHTEFFASRFEGAEPLMFMVGGLMRVGLVTIHEPLKEVAASLTTEAILKKLRLMKASLVRDFCTENPKIAVLGLNPHCGDGGLLGREEEEIIVPALLAAKRENILAFGPYAADGFFGSGAYKKFDGILAMYHDQGLIPFKALCGTAGVNFTAGLPVIRTSPDHGVGYDIAGQDKADETSLREALYLAMDVYRNRGFYDEISANPLRHYVKEVSGRDESVYDVEAKEKKEAPADNA